MLPKFTARSFNRKQELSVNKGVRAGLTEQYGYPNQTA